MMDKNNMHNNLKLQQTVRFFETLLRASADGIVITDPARNIIFVNDMFCKFFSSNRHEVIETNLFVWLAKLDYNAGDIWKGMETRINEHGIAKNIEFAMKTGEGMRYFSVNSSLLEKIDIEETGLIISIWRDDTKRKMAKEALLKAHDELDVRVKERTIQLTNTNIELKREITERKQVEEKLRESEERFKSIFDNALDGILVADIETKKNLLSNRMICRMLGFDEEEIKNTRVWDLHPEKDMPHVMEQFEKQARQEIELAKDIPMKRKDGSIFYADVNSTIITLGGKTYLLGIFRDITERKRIEEELVKSNAMLIKSEEIGHMGSWEWDPATNELVWSKEVYTIYGMDPEIYKPNFEIVVDTLAPECKDDFLKAIDDALKMRKPFDGKYRIILLDGTIKFTHTKGEVVYGKEGNPIRMYGIVQDITERKCTQEALRRSEQHYHTILQTAMDGFWVVDMQGHIIEVNEAYCRIIGYNRDELLGMTISDVESLETESEMRQHFQNIIDKGYDFFETRHRGKDGRIVDIEASVKYLPNEGILFVFMRDITQRKRAEESIRASLEEKTVLLHEVHHRVKNNLQIVSSLLNLQATRIKNREAIEALRETANRIQSMAMLHETLNISGNLSTVNFSTYIKKICFHILSSYGSKAENIKLETHIAEILIDLDQAVPCGLIINELVSNALKHGFPEGRKGRITVELQALPVDQIMLTVADDGIGLPPGLDIAQTETLGLKLVTILTEKLKGSVEIIRDRGTTFHIRFKGKINKETEVNV